MTPIVEVEQLKIWSDETDSRTKAAIAEFEEWSSTLGACGLGTPTLDPNDKHDVAFASAFHDVIADFEELEAPALRRERNQPGPGHSLTERLIAEVAARRHRRMQTSEHSRASTNPQAESLHQQTNLR